MLFGLAALLSGWGIVCFIAKHLARSKSFLEDRPNQKVAPGSLPSKTHTFPAWPSANE